MTAAKAFRAVAGAVPDPELPVITLDELGVLRDVRVEPPTWPDEGPRVTVELTPTYTGCPAVEAMADDIRRALTAHGAAAVTVLTVYAPPWSTDDISPRGRAKLAAAGIAPPRPRGGGPVLVPLTPMRLAPAPLPPPRCPQCGSADTELLSRFSSTACTALRRCATCREPFDHMKEH
nr:1,2-phenylacetyl-CoA epoxidase subunit PaaD [Streptomyces avicenniae]